MDIAGLAVRAQVEWFRGLAAAGFPQLTTGAGFAVSTGLDSNTENGAVIDPAVPGDPRELDNLLGWLRDRAVPASVLVTGPLEPEATARLIDRGLEPERAGNDMGGPIASLDLDAAEQPGPGWQITEVTDVEALRRNHRVYAEDGWWDDRGELDDRVGFAARLGFGPGRPVRHWTACHQGAPAGAATSFRFGDAVLLVHCCVAARWRRHGIGTALTRVRLAAAARQGAARAVLFPSPEGYHLHRRFGFDLVASHPDRWFYLR
ncbi:hypothetical protein Acy02nite_85180 [Actinoplanes cyaneus]|uniref:N-acetyltransferase domain-containing protein n=1 Tax=Actinoplanes cyaneus TaxID=52696 RepID=A0A919IUB5_9ACTN|nr:GNAT family N-acetyltransferase [Actinoplanes cyaneus]MCW2143863.1 Acetyltransferase (GNAT) family protein [Actinoplanes cyaneus]GID70637.1 hypothetical protein Acy02nite_85180 [Actinoplanes cyaneus]